MSCSYLPIIFPLFVCLFVCWLGERCKSPSRSHTFTQVFDFSSMWWRSCCATSSMNVDLVNNNDHLYNIQMVCILMCSFTWTSSERTEYLTFYRFILRSGCCCRFCCCCCSFLSAHCFNRYFAARNTFIWIMSAWNEEDLENGKRRNDEAVVTLE